MLYGVNKDFCYNKTLFMVSISKDCYNKTRYLGSIKSVSYIMTRYMGSIGTLGYKSRKNGDSKDSLI
jgi:hypothetical protein